jgi:hypothetical protein
VASATASATAGLRISGKKAAGKRCTCQNHHHSSYHDISFAIGGPSATGPSQTLAFSEKGKRQRRDGLKMGMALCRLY